MKRALHGLWLLALAGSIPIVALAQQSGAPPAAAQGMAGGVPAQPPKGTGVILGRVVDAASGRAIADAVVTLNVRAANPNAANPNGPLMIVPAVPAGMAGLLPGGPTAVKLLTDSDGRFVLREIPKGAVPITVTASGYVNGSVGQGRPGGPSRPVELEDGERRNDVVVKLWKYAVVSGRVVDEAGEPAVGTSVQILRKTMAQGRPRFASAGQTATDDRGVYRIASLTPGDFIVTLPQTQVTMPAAMVDSFLQGVTSGNGMGNLMLDVMSSGGPAPSPNGVRVDEFLWQSSTALRGSSATPPPPANGRLFAYQTLFYPGVTSIGQAATITLGSGEERAGLDLQLKLTPTARISGTVTSPNGPMSGVGVRLLPAGADDMGIDTGFETATTLTKPDGTFTFLGVAAGQYTAKVLKSPRPELPAELMSSPLMQMAFGGATAGKPTGQAAQMLAGELAVSVGGDDVKGLALMVHEGATVSGKFVFDGTAPPPTAQQLQNARIMLSPAGGGSGMPGLMSMGMNAQDAQLSADFKFKTPKYPAGRYLPSIVGIAVPTWRLKSISVGGRDLTDPLELKDADITDVVVTFTDKIGSITGNVRGGDGKPSPTATVILFPTDRKAWTTDPFNPRPPRTTTASKVGAYTAGGIISGDYFIAALADSDVGDTQDAAFFDALSRVATRITVAEGEKKSLDLQIVRIR